MGYGEEKLFLKSFLPRLKNIKSYNSAFSLAREAQRKSLAKRTRRNYGATKSERSEDQIMRSIVWDLGRKKWVFVIYPVVASPCAFRPCHPERSIAQSKFAK